MPLRPGSRQAQGRSRTAGLVVPAEFLTALLGWITVLAGCASRTPFISSATPLDVGGARLCIAFSEHDSSSVRWWESTRPTCDTRNTGPALFVPEHPELRSEGDAVHVQFELQKHDRSRQLIRLVVRDGTMRSEESQETVPIVRRLDLDIPEERSAPRINSREGRSPDR